MATTAGLVGGGDGVARGVAATGDDVAAGVAAGGKGVAGGVAATGDDVPAGNADGADDAGAGDGVSTGAMLGVVEQAETSRATMIALANRADVERIRCPSGRPVAVPTVR
jgi:hypothetical protein